MSMIPMRNKTLLTATLLTCAGLSILAAITVAVVVETSPSPQRHGQQMVRPVKVVQAETMPVRLYRAVILDVCEADDWGCELGNAYYLKEASK